MTDTTNTCDGHATAAVLTYLQRHVLKLGDTYTANLLGSLAASHHAGTLTHTAALKAVAGLLAHEDEAAAHEAARQASRVMAIEALANTIDVLFGRNTNVSTPRAVAALRGQGMEVPQRRVRDAIQRRRDRFHPFLEGGAT